MLRQNRAIILKAIKHGESDLIIHALNEEGEYLSLMAKGAMRSKKRFGGGVLEPTHCVKLNYKVGRENNMCFLNEAKLEKDFSGIRRDLDRLNVALHFLQVVRKVSQEGAGEQRALFNILGHALTQLESCSNVQTLKLQFEVKLLHQQGVLPPLADYSDLVRSKLVDVDSIVIPKADLSRIRSSIDSALTGYLG